MKKFSAIILSVLFVLSFAASAFAIHAEIPAETQAIVAAGTTQITLGGELRVRGWYENNISNAAGTSSAVTGFPFESGSIAYYDQRLRLVVDAKVSPNVQGYVQIETGNAERGDTTVWGSGINAKPSNSQLNLLQSWILYTGSGLLGIPAGLKIGHMPLALSHGQFFDNTQFGDDAIVFFMDPMKELHIGLLAVKFQEGADLGAAAGRADNTDDLDGYVALMTYKLDPKNTIGLNLTYLNRADGFDPAGPNDDNPAVVGNQQDGFHMTNIGLHAAGNIAGVGYKAEFDYQFGKTDGDSLDNPLTAVNEADETQRIRAWGIMLGANYKFEPVNLRASFAYGSGDENGFDDDAKFFNTFVGTIQHYTLVYDYRVATAALAVGTGISNTTYYNLGVDFTPTKDVNVSLDGYILRASKTGAFEDGILVATGGALRRDVSKNVGWEVDAKATYKVARNLTYAVNAGYFHAGHFYEDVQGLPSLLTEDAKNVTVLMHALTLSF